MAGEEQGLKNRGGSVGRKRNKKREKEGGKRIVLDILGIMGGDQFHLKMGGRPEAMLG